MWGKMGKVQGAAAKFVLFSGDKIMLKYLCIRTKN
jgi:hypothetical protein